MVCQPLFFVHHPHPSCHRYGSKLPFRSSTPWVWASGVCSPLPPTTHFTRTSIGQCNLLDPRVRAGRRGVSWGGPHGVRLTRPAPGLLPAETPSLSLWAMPSPASWLASLSSPCWATCLRSWVCLWTKLPKQVGEGLYRIQLGLGK